MQVVGQEDAHGLYVGVGQQVSVTGIDLGNPKGLAALLAPFGNRLRASHAAGKAFGFQQGKGLQMGLGDAAQSDEPDLQHVSCPGGR